MESKRDLKIELAHYSKWMRRVEVMSLVLFFLLTVKLAQRIWLHAEGRAALVGGAVLLGYFLADFISGIVHWFADTWGSYRWPVIGNTLIRSFREHHLDQTAITRHDFIEVNGASAMVCLPILGLCFLFNLNSSTGFLIVTTVLMLCFSTLWTGQIHKWSHQSENFGLVRALQKYRMILSPEHHARHHSGRLDQHYCMTSGWLNSMLNRLKFFRSLERTIQYLTKAVPRSEDRILVAESSKLDLESR